MSDVKENVLLKLESQDARDELAAILVDFIFEQPMNRLVSTNWCVALLNSVLSDEQYLAHWVEAHLMPCLKREAERAKETQVHENLGEYIEAEFGAELRAAMTKPRSLDRRWVEAALEQAVVEHLLKGIVAETLDGFVATARSMSRSNSLIGSMGRGALGLASRAGRNILGQVGEQMETHLRQAMKSFMTHSMTSLRKRVADIMMSDEVKNLMNRALIDAYDRAYNTDTADIWHAVQREIDDDLISALAAQLVYLWSMPQVQGAFEREVDAWLTVEGEKTLVDFMDPVAAETLKEATIIAIGPLLKTLGQYKPLEKWLDA